MEFPQYWCCLIKWHQCGFIFSVCRWRHLQTVLHCRRLWLLLRHVQQGQRWHFLFWPWGKCLYWWSVWGTVLSFYWHWQKKSSMRSFFFLPRIAKAFSNWLSQHWRRGADTRKQGQMFISCHRTNSLNFSTHFTAVWRVITVDIWLHKLNWGFVENLSNC